MKIRFKKNVVVEVENLRLQETWDKNYRRWEEIRVDNIITAGSVAIIGTYEGLTLHNVPTEAFEVVR